MELDKEALSRSVAAKLDRARDHVRTLDDESREFTLNSLAAIRTVEDGGRRHVITWTKYSPVPDRLGLIMGDAVHNTRSALDHLVWALAEAGAKYQGVTLTDSDERGLQFPTAKSQESFDNNKPRSLKCVPDAAVAYIEGRQPFTLDDPDRHFLAQLSTLDNTDKHRTLLPSVVVAGISSVSWPSEVVDAAAIQPAGSVRAAGEEICHYEFEKPYSEDELPMEFPFSVGITGQGIYSAVFILDTLIRNVESLIDDILSGAEVHGRYIGFPEREAFSS